MGFPIQLRRDPIPEMEIGMARYGTCMGQRMRHICHHRQLPGLFFRGGFHAFVPAEASGRSHVLPVSSPAAQAVPGAVPPVLSGTGTAGGGDRRREYGKIMHKCTKCPAAAGHFFVALNEEESANSSLSAIKAN